MASLQYVIDTICANFTPEAMYGLVKLRLSQGSFTIDEILPLIQNKDRSLDSASAKMIAEAALEAMARIGDIKVKDNSVYPV